MGNIEFNVVKEFSRTPSARIAQEGKHPGVELRTIIVPKLREAISNNVQFIINLDGAAGYGTSFLEEVFGGLIREEHFSLEELEKALNIISEEEPELIDEIWTDIKEANLEQ